MKKGIKNRKQFICLFLAQTRKARRQVATLCGVDFPARPDAANGWDASLWPSCGCETSGSSKREIERGRPLREA